MPLPKKKLLQTLLPLSGYHEGMLCQVYIDPYIDWFWASTCCEMMDECYPAYLCCLASWRAASLLTPSYITPLIFCSGNSILPFSVDDYESLVPAAVKNIATLERINDCIGKANDVLLKKILGESGLSHLSIMYVCFLVFNYNVILYVMCVIEYFHT